MSERLEIELCYIEGDEVYVTGIWGHVSPAEALNIENEMRLSYPTVADLPGNISPAQIVTVRAVVSCESNEGGSSWGINHDGIIRSRSMTFVENDLLDALTDIVSVAKQITAGPLWAYSKEIVRARDLVSRAKGLT